jgi:glycine/D-amino acid oxidase-like deaminating enzyme
MPKGGKRQELEGRAESLEAEEWIVDAGLAPRGEGLLLGQTTLVRPGGHLGIPPDPAPLEAALRQELVDLWPASAGRLARFHQVPVAFTPSGVPLAGPVANTEGLWAFSGFSGPYALVPPLAPMLAAAIDASPGSRSALNRALTRS